MILELWWWVEPLFETGVATLIIGGLIAFLLGYSGIAEELSIWLFAISVLPLLAAVVVVVLWFILNVYLSIWKG